MIFSPIINYFNQTSQSIGLPPIVLVFIISLSFFFFIIGLVVLSKIRKIRIELIDTTQHLHSLIQRLQADKEHLKTDNYNLKAANDHPKIELQKHGEKNSINKHSNRVIPFTEVYHRFKNPTGNSAESDFLKEELLENQDGNPEIRSKILSLFMANNRPISYSDIAKYLSQGSSETDFELILTELERLKTEGEIIGHVSAGKLYFQKNRFAI